MASRPPPICTRRSAISASSSTTSKCAVSARAGWARRRTAGSRRDSSRASRRARRPRRPVIARAVSIAAVSADADPTADRGAVPTVVRAARSPGMPVDDPSDPNRIRLTWARSAASCSTSWSVIAAPSRSCRPRSARRSSRRSSSGWVTWRRASRRCRKRSRRARSKWSTADAAAAATIAAATSTPPALPSPGTSAAAVERTRRPRSCGRRAGAAAGRDFQTDAAHAGLGADDADAPAVRQARTGAETQLWRRSRPPRRQRPPHQPRPRSLNSATPPAPPMKRLTSLSGGKLAVKVERDGEVVRR